jgi:hypothetical protein
MPKAVRVVSTAVPESFGSSSAKIDRSDFNQLISIALFSGIGLLISLVAVLYGMQGVWY